MIYSNDFEAQEDAQKLKSSNIWKYLMSKLEDRKLQYMRLAFETNPLEIEGQNNILHFQSMSGAIDCLQEDLQDILSADKPE